MPRSPTRSRARLETPAFGSITIRGEGQDFAAGNDLADFLTALPRDTSEIPVWRLLRALATCETPLIAAVHGNCVGIGTTMLLHCDLVVADETARFSMPFVDLALVPEAAARCSFRGWPAAAAPPVICCCASRSAPMKPRTIGLVSHRAPAGALDAKLDEIVAALLAKPPEALRQTQRLLRQGARDDVLERMKLESGHFTERLESAEVKEAIAAFFEKRKPNFAA